ncbi:MAG: helix-turn-helix transcriptional regulator [Lachnospiraceae bacterium]|nr:helix-turn-helix transcriptional regulator [Lachnospiraceae bacterium]
MNRKMIRFGENIKILRNKNGWTQEQLANEIYVTRQTISAWENRVSCPDINVLVKIHEAFDVSTDELIFGKMPDINENVIGQEEFYEETFIRSIKKKGFYEIMDEDIQAFVPIIDINFAKIIGIVMELKERHYQIVSVHSLGFSIYLSTDEEAEKFPSVLYNIMDEIIHFETEKTVVAYSEKVQEKIDKIEIEVLRETHIALFGAEMENMFYWIDELDQIRGYGNSEEECREQAKQQECTEYTILHE